ATDFPKTIGSRGLSRIHTTLHLSTMDPADLSKKRHRERHLTLGRKGKRSEKEEAPMPLTQSLFLAVAWAMAVPRASDTMREMPLEDTLRYQIQVQRELCEQLEVQKKLQMRIEAQVRYLKEILEKAQENISFDANGSAGL
ncbi:hypothetical protein ZWY2020_000171, partial [Hordeum vulgare]